MKKLYLILAILISVNAFAQNANTYFPANTGYKWYFKNTPLDSNNNPLTNLVTYRIDSFAVNSVYFGLSASIVLSKDNLISIGQNTPYTDTLAHNFQTTNGYEYINPINVDTLPIGGLINFIRGLKGWYNVFRFAQSVNQEYTIFSKDTTVAVDTVTLPLRFILKGKRLNDETVSTVNGNYPSKKFLLTFQVGVLPLPIIFIPVLTVPDTTWLAQNVWLVKNSTPSSNLNLSNYGIPVSLNIPGNITELTLPVGIKNITTELPEKFFLEQNYPNPFNSSSVIKFHCPVSSSVTLRIYDINGRELETLVNNELTAGTYSVKWNSGVYSSGVYFYKLQADGFSETKRMNLVK